MVPLLESIERGAAPPLSEFARVCQAILRRAKVDGNPPFQLQQSWLGLIAWAVHAVPTQCARHAHAMRTLCIDMPIGVAFSVVASFNAAPKCPKSEAPYSPNCLVCSYAKFFDIPDPEPPSVEGLDEPLGGLPVFFLKGPGHQEMPDSPHEQNLSTLSHLFRGAPPHSAPCTAIQVNQGKQ